MNKNDKYIVYKNDLKYKKHRNLDKSKAIFNNNEVENLFNVDLDTINYRIKECIDEKCITLDLKCMSLTDDTFPHIDPTIAKKVKYLFLGENNLTKIPIQIKNFINLKVLEISHNKLINVSHLPLSLTELCVRDNPLKAFDESINLNALEILDCSNCQLKTIPKFINLKILSCGHNDITAINDLIHLTKLLCESNQIKEINNCTKLKYLDCNKNPVCSLSDNMNNLEHLICSDTSLSLLPYSSPLKSVESFNNKITKLYYIASLNEFLCNVNQIKNISAKYKIKSSTEYKKKFVHIIFCIEHKDKITNTN
jgi:Leucine-rich repeat (LRR) protein